MPFVFTQETSSFPLTPVDTKWWGSFWSSIGVVLTSHEVVIATVAPSWSMVGNNTVKKSYFNWEKAFTQKRKSNNNDIEYWWQASREYT